MPDPPRKPIRGCSPSLDLPQSPKFGIGSRIGTNDMPALDLLPGLDPEERRRFETSLATATLVADRLPLVRVVVAQQPPRHQSELADVLSDGLLKPIHKSNSSRDREIRLGAPDLLYFHAGRTHPDYGAMVFVIEDLPSPPDVVTPFGLGGLLCARTHPPDALHCVMPVSHQEEGLQRAFYQASRFTAALAQSWCSFLVVLF